MIIEGGAGRPLGGRYMHHRVLSWNCTELALNWAATPAGGAAVQRSGLSLQGATLGVGVEVGAGLLVAVDVGSSAGLPGEADVGDGTAMLVEAGVGSGAVTPWA